MIKIACSACKSMSSKQEILIKDMLFTSKKYFNYFECLNCGTLSFYDKDVPLASYYNDSYGSFIYNKSYWIKTFFKLLRNKYLFFGEHKFFGYFINKLAPLSPDLFVISKYANKDSNILDFGCGRGNYLNDLSDLGYKNLFGYEPFIEEDVKYINGVQIKKRLPSKFKNKFDVIFSHHSFEHIKHPDNELKKIYSMLNKNGVCIITVPVAEELFKKYREYCYLIQAPQHYFLFSIKGFSILLRRSKFHIDKIQRDASCNLVWAFKSEMWKKDILFNDSNFLKHKKTLKKNEISNIFSFDRKIKELHLGDNVIFILRK